MSAPPGPTLVSLVVVCHEMARELPRTIRSLSPGYQCDAEPGRCEIVVVDNGSAEVPDAERLRAHGADVRVLSMPDACVSPVPAVNAGLAAARGDLVGVWIDGARLASPGLLAACAAASRLHPRPVIAPLNYQLGPKLQYLSGDEGYDQATEDALLASIDWPRDGYRLFDVSACEVRDPPRGQIGRASCRERV